VFGATGVLSGGALGFTLGLAVDPVSFPSNGSLIGLGTGAVLGGVLTIAPGVWLAGHVLGGNGGFGWTLLGDALGASVGVTAAVLAPSVPTAVLAAAAPLVGAILGYELSSHPGPPARPQRSARMAPAIYPTGTGVAGVF
jgi:hypothetical protein